MRSGPTTDMEGCFDLDVVNEPPSTVQASEAGLFRRRKKYHAPHTMTRTPRTPNKEPSAMATTERDLDLGVDVAVACVVDEAMMGFCVGVGDRDEDVEEVLVVVMLVVLVVKLP